MASVKKVTVEYHAVTTQEGSEYYGGVYRQAKVDGQVLQGYAAAQQMRLGPYPSRREAYRSAVKRRKLWAKADYLGVPISEVE